MYSDILFGILSGILCDIYSDILSGTCSGVGCGVHTASGAGRGGGEEEKKEAEGVTPSLRPRGPHLAGGENHTIGRLQSHLRLRVLDSHEKRRKDRKG